MQSFVMKTYDKFLGIVARERNLPADVLRNTVADGRILSGKDALDNKLIDGLGQIEDAFAKAKELGNCPGGDHREVWTALFVEPGLSRVRQRRGFQNRADASEAARPAIGNGPRLFSAELLRSLGRAPRAWRSTAFFQHLLL